MNHLFHSFSIAILFFLLVRDATSCLDWRSGILATGSWDGSVKIWNCNEINGYTINVERDFVAQLDHNSQVRLSLTWKSWAQTGKLANGFLSSFLGNVTCRDP